MSVEQDKDASGTPNVSGRGSNLSLDMNDCKDRGMLNEALRRWPKRWRGLNDETKDELVEGLKEANRVARAQLTDPDSSLDAAKTVAQIVGVAARIEGQNQADDHHADDVKRGANEGAKVQTIVLVGAEQSRLLRPPEGT